TREAFSYPGRVERGGIGSPYEHWMVHELRKRDGIGISLVAELDQTLVGHIICSKSHIVTPDGRNIPTVNFGPFSVLPTYQRKGFGKALIHAMIDKVKEQGHGAIMFFGRPEYYPKFGFVESEQYGVTDNFGENYPAFMCMELIDGYLSSANGGKYIESDIYDDKHNKEAVIMFDKAFS
ncbi:GNAT family N-acetyltransferase, partial [Anaerosporobacter sp.]